MATVLQHVLAQTLSRLRSAKQSSRSATIGAGLDFADALRYTSYRDCAGTASFDDKQFPRRARNLGLAPAVTVPNRENSVVVARVDRLMGWGLADFVSQNIPEYRIDFQRPLIAD